MPKRETGSRLEVYMRDHLVGHLWLDERNRFVFQYSLSWLQHEHAAPLSLSLPMREESYADDTARPFFSNLLPEAEIRRVLTRRLGISDHNDFALLREIGQECAGAVSILPKGLKPRLKQGYRELSEKELHKVIAELPKRPLLYGEEGVRLSLAGAQSKLPVYMEGDRIFLATGNSPSTHILKPPIPDLKETVENETFCMRLAAGVGLSVPKTTLRTGTDRLYIVERFDRERDQAGEVIRLHQEDFCQALGVLPDQKYESEGGPSLVDCFSLLKRYSSHPAADQKALLTWVIFNFLTGNSDSHPKNLAMLFTPEGPRLAPFYDLICTRVYPDLSHRLAMRIGGENRSEWVGPRHWDRLAASVDIKPRFIHVILREMARRLSSNVASSAAAFSEQYGHSSIVEEISTLVKKSAAKAVS
ncbi:MAG: type II toxin-antitoxin system HipA family toxin [Desulfobacteraceae bacterium]|nr:MAG: type II toxin-antitoxin system HipA family toxin [Desulfobacteraceae bacterium]